MLTITKTATGATFRVRVQPRANKNEIMQVREDALRVRINAAPIEGKANKVLIQFLSKQLGVKRSQVQILSGHTSRIKTIRLLGEGIEKKLQNIIDSISV